MKRIYGVWKSTDDTKDGRCIKYTLRVNPDAKGFHHIQAMIGIIKCILKSQTKKGG